MILYVVDRAPHASSAHYTFGAFSRSWIAPAITSENWRERGMLRWHEGRIVYVCIVRAVEFQGTAQTYTVRVSLPDGHRVWELGATFATLDDALGHVRPGADTILGAAAVVEPGDYPPDTRGNSLIISRGPT